LDQAFAEFMSYLRKSGLMKNSMIVVYGDHYGISNNHRPAIAQLLHKKSITDYDLAQFQKVPFMIHATGLKGGVNHAYGGEIDVLPTILHLLGDKNNNTIQFGTDLLSKQHDQRVAFRDGDFVTPKYTKVGSDVYLTSRPLKTEQNFRQTNVQGASIFNRSQTFAKSIRKTNNKLNHEL
jgi:lipoteichoic acid synthase